MPDKIQSKDTMDHLKWEYPWPVPEQKEGSLEEATDSPWTVISPTETVQQLQTRIKKFIGG